MARGRRLVVGAKVAPAEKKLVEAAAAAEGVSVSAWIYDLVLPAARTRVAREFGLSEQPTGEAR